MTNATEVLLAVWRAVFESGGLFFTKEEEVQEYAANVYDEMKQSLLTDYQEAMARGAYLLDYPYIGANAQGTERYGWQLARFVGAGQQPIGPVFTSRSAFLDALQLMEDFGVRKAAQK